MSVFEECWLPSWKMNSSRCRRKWPHLCSCSANGLNFFQHPPRWSWHRSRGKQQDQIFLSLHDPSRPAKALQFFVGTAKSLQAALLTDAQLVSDGLSSLVLNGARVQSRWAFYVQAKFISHFLLSVFPWVRKLNHLWNDLRLFLSLLTQTCLSGD